MGLREQVSNNVRIMSHDVDAHAVLVVEALIEAVDDGRIDLEVEPWLAGCLRRYRRLTEPKTPHEPPESATDSRHG